MAVVAMTGFKEVMQRLETLGRAKARAVIRRGLREAAKFVAEDARRRVPRDSGDLASSIKVRAGERSRTQVSMLVVSHGEGTTAGQKKSKSRFAGKTYYGSFIELGHFAGSGKPVRDWKGRSEYRNRVWVPAQPFLRPALYDNEDLIVSIVEREIRDALLNNAIGSIDAGEGID